MKISVRNLVEFMLREGDLDSSSSGGFDTDAMQIGSRLHRKIQKRMGSDYQAEVALFAEHEILVGKDSFILKVEGRADGIIGQEPVMIDEIKTTSRDIFSMEKPHFVHQAQAMCYAYMVARKEGLSTIGVQMTYVNIESELERRFQEYFSFFQIEEWYLGLIEDYSKWAIYQHKWKQQRDKTIQQLEFPFPYREGQKGLVAAVYRTIQQEKKLYIQAPTGVGKTVSTIYPAIRAMGEGLTQRIFYLTAKTITRTVAEECFAHLQREGLVFKGITLTAKEKLCVLDKVSCNPHDCPRAKGHFDRVNESIYDMLIHEQTIDRDLILAYGEKHQVCPFEMSLDASLYADGIICDYNYVFDPNIYLRRFFMGDKKTDAIFLVDEAHNLVERGREMYSALLYKDDFLKLKRVAKQEAERTGDKQVKQETMSFIKALESANHQMLEWRKQCDEFREVESIGLFQFQILRAVGEFEVFLKNFQILSEKDTVLEFYFALRHFSNILELLDDKYVIYTDYDEENHFRVKLQCMDPSTNLKSVLDKGKSAVFFSATLLPIRYYKEQLAGDADDFAVYAPSSFPKENRKIMIARDVSTMYKRRSPKEYEKIANYLREFVASRQGNYLVFFPSYAFMDQIFGYFSQKDPIEIIRQGRSMSEVEREEFLLEFSEDHDATKVGFCVMGGVFSEGIDLKNDRLIGAAIVGTGLPMVCNERELFRRFYQEKKGAGFDYGYLYPGMNKVLQSGGRVIRTVEDKGAILLLDERFGNQQYLDLFPREWYPYENVNLESMKVMLKEFWE